MLDEGNRFLYASLVACALARRLRDRAIIQSIIEVGVSPAPEDERAMYATESVSASSDDERDIVAADPRCVLCWAAGRLGVAPQTSLGPGSQSNVAVLYRLDRNHP